MGRFNTYQSDLKYTPQSFEKLAALPMQLRKEHDKFISDSDLQEVGWNDTKVSSGFEAQVSQKRSVFNEKSKALSERLAKEGAGNPELVNEFRQMKRDYNQEASATGVLGMGARRFKEEKEAEKEYTTYGVTKALQGSSIVAENWNDKMKKENDAIREGYAKDPNFVPTEMVHEYAPGKYTVADFALKVAGLIGKDSGSKSGETINGQKMETLSLQEMMSAMSYENGVPIINQNSDAWIKNEKQVKEFAELTKSELANPASDLHKHLAYNKQDMSMFLNDVQHIAGMMLSESKVETSAFKGLPGGSPTGPTEPAEPEKEQAALVKIHDVGEDLSMTVVGYNGGEPFDMTPQNAGATRARLEALIKNDSSLSKNADFNIAHSKSIALDIRQAQMAEEFPGYKEKAFEKYYNDNWVKPNVGYVGIKSNLATPTEVARNYKDFRKQIDSSRDALNQMALAQKTHFYTKGSREGGGSTSVSIEDGFKELEKQEKEVYKGMSEFYESGAKKMLVSSDNYTFSPSAASDLVSKRENAYLTKEFQSILTEADRTQSKAYTQAAGTINMTPLTMQLVKDKGTPTSVELASISTSGVKGYPGLRLKITHKLEKGEDITYLDLGLNDSEGKANYARNIYQDILKNTADPETRALLNVGLENSRASKISSNHVSMMGKGWTKTGNRQITNEASASGLKDQTINANGSHAYESIQDENGYYGISIANARKGVPAGEFRMYSVKDFIYDRVNAVNPTIKENQLKAKAAQLALFMKPNLNAAEKKDAFGNGVMRPSRSAGDRETMFDAIKTYNDQMHDKSAETKTGISHGTAMAISREFLAKVENIGIMSKSKLMFISGNREDIK